MRELKDGENLYLVVYRDLQMSNVLEMILPGLGRLLNYSQLFIYPDDITCVDQMLYNDAVPYTKVAFIYNLTTKEAIYDIHDDLPINVIGD